MPRLDLLRLAKPLSGLTFAGQTKMNSQAWDGPFQSRDVPSQTLDKPYQAWDTPVHDWRESWKTEHFSFLENLGSLKKLLAESA